MPKLSEPIVKKSRFPKQILLDIFSIYLMGGFQYFNPVDEKPPLKTSDEIIIRFDLKDLMNELKEALNNE